MKTVIFLFIVVLLFSCKNNENVTQTPIARWELQQTKLDEIFEYARVKKNINWEETPNDMKWKTQTGSATAEFTTFCYSPSNIYNFESFKLIDKNDTLVLYRMFSNIAGDGKPIFSYWVTDWGLLVDAEINKKYLGARNQDTAYFDTFLHKLPIVK